MRYTSNESRSSDNAAGLRREILEAVDGLVSELLDARRDAGRARALLQLAAELTNVLTEEEVADELVGALPRLLDLEFAAVMLWDAPSASARVGAALGIGSATVEVLGELRIGRDDFPELDRIACSTDVFEVARDRASASTAAVMSVAGVDSLAFVPMIARQSLHGFLVLPSDRLGDGNRDHVRAIAVQGALALASARLISRIQFQALHDNLTGVANRMLLFDRLTQAIEMSARSGAIVALLYVDLDRFKEINDTLGHATGDDILCAVTARLAAETRASDTVARLGGDEFAVVLTNLIDETSARTAATHLTRLLQQPYEVGGRSMVVTASVGLALAAEGDTAEQLLHAADEAMYRMKAATRSNPPAA